MHLRQDTGTPGLPPGPRPALFKEAPGAADRNDTIPAAPDNAPGNETLPDPARPALACRVCRTVVTARQLAVTVGGAHRHVFFNPHGHVFEIGCFASARNILPSGPPTAEFSWFAGYAWQAVLCAGCAGMLGWRFTGQDPAFFGLILPALVEVEEPRA
ncbi:hypothetical protein GKC30_08455 [Pseudodesulfovibrio sp. F-1]|uniref:CULT domain-containing protein n=1 Tax=Pseudodesulfovibrio alkaliphilus TaxID=2661613 RepID=A0A7K1KP42_9BACT|nr:cereblon family protein [Pseudodesulfovibrio alkaliphilus]MUM77662.1 hypothetical protein [Pseudodesulfovibrio alkaliphilus]